MFKAVAQSVKISTAALLSNKGRSFLTMLGIIIGVASVIIIMSIGAGAQSLILSQVESLGTNLVGIIPGHSEEDNPFSAFMGFSVTTLTYDDAVALRDSRSFTNIVDVAAYSKGVGTVIWGSESYDTNLSGTTAGYLNVEGGTLSEGRFFTSEEEKNLSRIVVLGSTVKNELFGESDAVGRNVRIRRYSFEVIGVMEERGIVALEDYDDQVLLPIRTMQRLFGVTHVGLIRAKIDSEKNISMAINDIKLILRGRHDIDDPTGKNDDFTVRSSVQALDMITSITNALKYFLAAMAALSLIVGGIGIMNIMLISVTERTREIGLRKAIGANNFNILSQFLFEAVTMTLFGGVAGIVCGACISLFISLGAKFAGYDWAFIVSPLSIVLAFGVSGIVGLLFGLYPARKASGLDPIEALRYE